MTEVAIIQPVVIAKGGCAVTSSHGVARVFEKQHKDVLRKIDELIGRLPHLRGRNFTPTLEDVPGPNGAMRQERAFEMDRKGFSLLAMRFTGDKALAWQDAYTDEFDRMEAALHSGVVGAVGLTSGDRLAIGGIVKSVAPKAITDQAPAIIQAALPAIIAAELSSHRFQLVEGVSATEVAELAGYGVGRRPRGFVQFVSRRLTRLHENRGIPVRRSRHDMGKVKLFDEPASRAWLRSGGQAEIDLYATERKGQGKLALVK